MRGPKGYLSIPGALLLAALFFAPWLNLRCGQHEIGKASGWQLMVGQITVGDGGCPRAGKGPSQAIQARWWVALGLALPGVVLLAGHLARRGVIAPIAAGRLIGVAALAGIGLMIAAANVDYGHDLEAFVEGKSPPQGPLGPRVALASPPSRSDEMSPELMQAAKLAVAQAVGSGIRTKPAIAYWMILALYAVLTLSAIPCFLASPDPPEARAVRAPPTGPSPPTDAAPPSLGEAIYSPAGKTDGP